MSQSSFFVSKLWCRSSEASRRRFLKNLWTKIGRIFAISGNHINNNANKNTQASINIPTKRIFHDPPSPSPAFLRGIAIQNNWEHLKNRRQIWEPTFLPNCHVFLQQSSHSPPFFEASPQCQARACDSLLLCSLVRCTRFWEGILCDQLGWPSGTVHPWIFFGLIGSKSYCLYTVFLLESWKSIEKQWLHYKQSPLRHNM